MQVEEQIKEIKKTLKETVALLYEKIEIFKQETYDRAYDTGWEDAIENHTDDEKEQEKLCTNYAIQQFKEIKTFEEFKNKYKEIETESFRHL